ncbi:MAG: M43 family zinc metalloprotease [Chitinophagaceae bacterium]
MKNFIICLILSLSVFSINAQNTPHEICGYQHEVERILKNKPNFLKWQEAWYRDALDKYNELQSSKRGDITADTLFFEIPVVFHIVYNNNAENINDSLVHNQMLELNRAFRKLTQDTSRIRSIFKPLAADVRIQFKLATVDENGNATTGITRTFTSRTTFATNIYGSYSNFMKVSGSGGKTAWNPAKYLNIWVCDMEFPNYIGIVYGFATPPTGAPNWDNSITKDTNDLESGVVLHYKIVGRKSPLAPSKYTEGKTAVHEVGHYLGLRHIWGDGNTSTGCSVDDGIFDTPNARVANATCGGQNTCVDAMNDKPDMTENYMDYALDGCAAMYTNEQAFIMRYVLNNLRPGLPYREIEFDTAVTPVEGLLVSVYPNPAAGSKTLKIKITEASSQTYTLNIIDMSGKQVITQNIQSNTVNPIDAAELADAVYYITIRNKSGEMIYKQAIITQ